MPRRKQRSLISDLFQSLVAMPWWVGPVFAAFVAVLLYVVLPALFGRLGGPDDPMTTTMTPILVRISTGLAPIAGLAVLMIWGAAEIRKLTNRRRLDNQTGRDSIGELSWQAFEELIAEAFRRQGYEVEVTGDTASDGGVDVILRRHGRKTLVQCKHWRTRKVGVQVVRELRGAMAGEKADEGIVVSYGTFTPDAVTFASENGITLIGGSDLLTMIRSVQKHASGSIREPAVETPAGGDAGDLANLADAQAAPVCPQCGTMMTIRTAKRGANAGSQFWGCPRYPACRETRPA